MPDAHPPITPRDLLRNRDFRLLWIGQSISNFGDSMTNLALLLLVNHLTGSTAALATMAIVLALPTLTFGLIAGVYVDRWDRKRVMVVSDVIRGVLVLGFVLVDTPEKLWLLYLIGFLQASIGTFFNPARSALIPNLIPKEGLLAANSLTQMTQIIFGLLGAGAAGAIIDVFDVYWPAFVIDAVTFFAALTFVAFIHYQNPSAPPCGRRFPEDDPPRTVWRIADHVREPHPRRDDPRARRHDARAGCGQRFARSPDRQRFANPRNVVRGRGICPGFGDDFERGGPRGAGGEVQTHANFGGVVRRRGGNDWADVRRVGGVAVAGDPVWGGVIYHPLASVRPNDCSNRRAR